MPEKDRSVVSEALPKLELYRPPVRLEPQTDLRARMFRRGSTALSNTDLVTLILGLRRRRTAEQLIRRHGLAGIADLTLPGLARSGYVGEGSAVRLAAVLELARRVRSLGQDSRPKVTKAAEVYAEVRDIRHLRKEHLVGLYLDAQNQLIHRETLSVGALNTTRTHPREILFPAIQYLALGFILAHNHPSGGLEPSAEDIEFTQSIQRAGELVGIELYDHVIVSTQGYTSLRERGLL